MAAPDPTLDAQRPRTRAECENGPRPCPWTRCRYYCGAEAGRKAALATCALDLADEGGLDVDAVARVLHETQACVRQVEEHALAKLAKAARRSDDGLGAWRPPPPPRKLRRRLRNRTKARGSLGKAAQGAPA